MKPMLAAPAPENIKFPVLASPKIDGVRAIIDNDGNVLSRSLKPIRNRFVQDRIGDSLLAGLDGELVVGEPHAPNCMQATTSGVMSADGTPDFTFFVFDRWDTPTHSYLQRARDAAEVVRESLASHLVFLDSTLIGTQQGLDDYEAKCLERGYEGVMLRDPSSPYKYGRSTAREGYLLKLKRFVDSEAIVIGVEELMHNDNAAVKNALGHTERSTAKAGLRGAGVLGTLLVRDVKTGVEFGIGSGFTAAQRAELWHMAMDCHENVPPLVGRIVTYKHFANGGVKDAPRFPVFKSFRSLEDL